MVTEIWFGISREALIGSSFLNGNKEVLTQTQEKAKRNKVHGLKRHLLSPNTLSDLPLLMYNCSKCGHK